MKILLIRPKQDKNTLNLSHFTQSEPLGLEMLSTIFSPYGSIEIFDMVFESKGLTKKLGEGFDLIGISSVCNDIESLLTISKLIKATSKKTRVFVGGFQVSLSPQEFFVESIDYVVVTTIVDSMVAMLKGERTMLKGIITKENNFGEQWIGLESDKIVANRKATEKYRRYYSYFAHRPVALLDSSSSSLEVELDSIEEALVAFIDYDILARELDDLIEVLGRSRKRRYIAYSSVDSILSNRRALKDLANLGLEAIICFFGEVGNREVEAGRVLKENNISLWAYATVYPDYDKRKFIELGSMMEKVEAKVLTLTPYLPMKGEEDYIRYRDRFLYEDIAKHYGKVVIEPIKLSITSYYYQILKLLLFFHIKRAPYFLKTFGIFNTLRFIRNSITFALKTYKVIFDLKN